MSDAAFKRLCARVRNDLRGAPSFAAKYQDEWALAKAQSENNKAEAKRVARRKRERERRRRAAL